MSPGGVIAFTLTYTNIGNQAATNVLITETVPANTTFKLSSSTAGWTGCADGAAAGTVCTFSVSGAVAGGGGGGSVVFAVNVPSSVPGNTVISNTASIGDDGANGPDPSGNNSGSDTATVAHHIYLPLILKGNP